MTEPTNWRKLKTIALETWEGAPDTMTGPPPYTMVRKWRITKVTDSIEFSPGDEIDKETVERLANDEGWKVTITPTGKK
jgi:hypothetical protein